MTGREIVKDIMVKKKISNCLLARKLGISQEALWDRLDTQPRASKPRKDIPLSLMEEMVQALDYMVLIVPSNTRLPKDGYAIGETTILQKYIRQITKSLLLTIYSHI